MFRGRPYIILPYSTWSGGTYGADWHDSTEEVVGAELTKNGCGVSVNFSSRSFQLREASGLRTLSFVVVTILSLLHAYIRELVVTLVVSVCIYIQVYIRLSCACSRTLLFSVAFVATENESPIRRSMLSSYSCCAPGRLW